jgi:drug/metabolite transporter (DMT)-like permease
MATGLWDSLTGAWNWHFWYGTVGLVAGAVVLAAPFVLSRRFRRWVDRSDVDIEHIGLLALIAVLLCIGIPHYPRIQ